MQSSAISCGGTYKHRPVSTVPQWPSVGRSTEVRPRKAHPATAGGINGMSNTFIVNTGCVCKPTLTERSLL